MTNTKSPTNMTLGQFCLCLLLLLFAAGIVYFFTHYSQYSKTDPDPDWKSVRSQIADFKVRPGLKMDADIYVVASKAIPVFGGIKSVFVTNLRTNESPWNKVKSVFTEKEYPIGTKVKIADVHNQHEDCSDCASKSFPLIIQRIK